MSPGEDARIVDAMRVHEGEVAKEAWDFFFRFFEEVDRLGKPVIVEGGWAVAAHGSPIPSVDLDLLVRHADLGTERTEDRAFYDLLHGEGEYGHESIPSAVDWSGLEDFNPAWASARGYARADLLAGRTIEAVVRAPDGRSRRIRIPTLPALLAMKLKAFRDRAVQHRVATDPVQRASYDEHDVQLIHPDPNYRLRKAAKDLVDIGFLWGRASAAERAEVASLLRRFQLDGLIRTTLARIDADVLAAADYLIRTHRLGFPAEGVGEAVASTLGSTVPTSG